MPRVPTSAAAAVTLRSTPSILLADQGGEKLPDSKPSAKIKSVTAGVFVTVGVGVRVGVLVGVGEGPGVDVAVGVLVLVGVRLGVGVPGPEILISQILPSFSFALLSLSTPRLAI